MFRQCLRHLPSHLHHFLQNLLIKPDFDPARAAFVRLVPYTIQSGRKMRGIRYKTSDNRFIEPKGWGIFKCILMLD